MWFIETLAGCFVGSIVGLFVFAFVIEPLLNRALRCINGKD